jgi:hypothetical protein
MIPRRKALDILRHHFRGMQNPRRSKKELSMSDLHLTYRCPACQRVKNQPGEGSVDQDWCTMADYVKRYPIPGPDVLLSEFYCSECSASYDRLVEYSRATHSCFLQQ